MSKRATKRLMIAAIVVGGAVLAIVAIVAILPSQKIASFVIQRAIPDNMKVQSVEGSLLGPLTLRGVTIQTPRAKIHVDRMTADWSPGALFKATVDVNPVIVSGVDVYLRPTNTATMAGQNTGPPRLKPPLSVNLEHIELHNAVIHSAAGKQPFVIKMAVLSGTLTKKKLNIEQLQAHGPLFDLTGHMSIVPDGDYAAAGQLDFKLHLPRYAPASGAVIIAGSLRNLRATLATAPPYNLQAALVADTLDQPVKLRAQVTLNAMRLRRVHAQWPAIALEATANLQGAPKDLEFRLQSELHGKKPGTIDIALVGGLENRIATIANLNITRPHDPMRLHAHGQVGLGGKVPILALNFDWHDLGYPFNGPVTITIPRGRAAVDGTLKQLRVVWQTAIGRQGRIQGDARRAGEHIALNMNWQKLRWPGGGGTVASPGGTLALDGTLSHYQLDVDARMTAPGQTQGHLTVRGAGNRYSIDLSQIDLKALQGELTGTAQAQWKPALDGRIHLRGHGINPGLLIGGWPGSLDIKLDARAVRHGGALTASVSTLSVAGKLRGYPVALNANLDYRDKTLELHRFALKSGPSSLSAQGRVGQQLHLRWQFRSPDLASLYPDAGGALSGHGRIEGPRKKPHVVATLNGRRLEVPLRGIAYAFKTLNVNANVDLQGKQRSSVNIGVADGTAGNTEIHSIRLAARGTPADHRVTLDVNTSRGSVQLGAAGSLKGRRWHFTLRKATLGYPRLAPWHLADPSSGYVGKGTFSLAKTCWVTGQARACLHAERSGTKFTGAFRLTHLAFAYLAPLTPPTVGTTGSISAEGRFERNGGSRLPTVHITANTTQTVLLAKVPKEPGAAPNTAAPPRRIVAFAPSHLKLDLDGHGLQIDAALNLLRQKGGLFFTARIPGSVRMPLLKRPLDAALRADIPDIGFVSRFNPTAGKIGGRLEGTMRVDGTLAAPALHGRIALADGSAELPQGGLKLTDVGLVLAGLPNGGISINGNAQSGGGAIAIDGQANLIAKPRHATVTIRGEQFQALDNAFGTVFISPDLTMTLRGRALNLAGTVKVPKARLTLKEIPQSAVKVSKDQVILRPGKKNESTFARSFNADIHLVLGDNVHFKGFGLKSRITGALEIVEEGNAPTRASGQLNLVKGEYRAYGQGLVIEQGTLLFAGPITEPGIDLRAVRHPAEDVTVGVSISGTLKQPDFELFSDPPMTQAETLSWLVLGRPLNDTSDQQGSALSRLALGLGITQSNKVAKNLGKNLGLDTFSIKTGSGEAGAASDVDQAALVIGKYLSPRLYVSYGIGLFEPVNTVRLEYTLSSRWKLVTESSSIASGGDLIYTLETP